ncbi:MAG: hypothetical protein ACYCY5_00160 [Sulfuricella sp.]
MQTRPIPRHERGAALLIILTIIGIGAAFLLVSALNKANQQIERDKITAAALAQAKDALIGYAVANTSTPGGLPFSDRNNDGNYDGNGDCVTTTTNTSDSAPYLLGKWPSNQEVGCFPTVAAFGLPLTDSHGETLWYAVSGNLVRSNSGNYPGINSSMLTSTAGWFTVVNGQGAVLTNRAAAVILAPGGVLLSQTRGGAAPSANQFLEAATIGGTSYTNYAIEAVDTGFVSRDADDTFNDRLLYITADELMTSVTKRVAQELKQHLDAYGAAYPPAGDSSGECQAALTTGTIPLTDADSDCGGALTGLPTWFQTNWFPVATYTRASATQATLSFTGCDITYTLNLGAPTTQDQPGC